MRSKKIYIAGPMRGYPEFNFPAFASARDLLNSRGWDAISPADMDIAIGFDPKQPHLATPEFLDAALRRDIDAILESQAIYMLKGWENSVGARAEYWLARWRGIEIHFEPGAHEGDAQPMRTTLKDLIADSQQLKEVEA